MVVIARGIAREHVRATTTAMTAAAAELRDKAAILQLIG